MKRTRSLVLVVAVVAILTAAVGAAGATASGFVAGGYPTGLAAAPTTTHFIKTNSKLMQCEAPTITSALAGPSESVESTGVGNWQCQEYSLISPVKMNSCGFTFKPGPEVAPGQFAGSFGIGPEGCGPVVIEGPCKLTIPPQEGLKATYYNEGSGSSAKVRIVAEVSTLKYTQGSGCGQPGTFTNGTWTGTWLLTGNAGVSVRTTGLYMAGSAETPTPPRLAAENYPTTFTSEILSMHRFLVGGEWINCKSANYRGSLSASTSAFTVTPIFSRCSFATVDTGSCQFVFHVSNAGPPYVGTMDIVCGPGGAITINRPGCTVKIGPQSGLSGVQYANDGAGVNRTVKITVNVSGISYDECGTPRTNGSYVGGMRLGAI